ncbi:glycosyl transferase family 2 [Hoeflea marina]|uniref:Glycosyl transferase family 2 n=1 Tax=Hoeflea marina TaxID=274592 RepID=A0A317PIJ6_9HYPH|nr:glycosyltransferase family 2 protein [Hoeflea marina]PWV99200.1 glycosyl transferase family 2 [Hoeflea marina]
MTRKPLFSVLMPTHSRVDVIGHSIASVLAQDEADFELLVVGDGAAAGTAELVAGFGDPRIRYLGLPKAPDFGYANRNAMLRQSRGRFIAFAADDDLWLPDHLAILAAALEGGAALAHTQALWVSTDGIAAPFPANLEIADQHRVFMESHNTIPASCFAYRADCLERRDAWPEDVAAAGDWRLWQRIIRENPDRPVVCCPVMTALHFSALWKRSRHSGMPQLAAWLGIADTVSWWPAELKAAIPDGSTEQEAYAARLCADPTGWSRSIRRAADDVADHLAWTHLQQGAVDPAALRADLAAALSARDAALTERDAALAEVQALRASTSWRLTAPLRALRRPR